MSHMIAISQAGYRESAWLRELYERGEFPRKWSLADVFDRARYDAHADEIVVVVNAAELRWRVERP